MTEEYFLLIYIADNMCYCGNTCWGSMATQSIKILAKDIRQI